MTFGINKSAVTDETYALMCQICCIDLAIFDRSNILVQSNARWRRAHGLDADSAESISAMRCWPADDASDRADLINHVRSSGVPAIFDDQCHSNSVETAAVPVSDGMVMLIGCASGIDRSNWPSRLSPPELFSAAAEASNRTATLSKREREVFGMLAGGMTIKQVADTLGRSEKTIEGHRDSIYRKLNVRNRAEIAIIAMRAGMLNQS
jgi:DNA-binding CsgD family transcriptional regulator